MSFNHKEENDMFTALIISRDGSDKYEYTYHDELDLYYHLHRSSENHEFKEPMPTEHYDDIVIID